MGAFCFCLCEFVFICKCICCTCTYIHISSCELEIPYNETALFIFRYFIHVFVQIDLDSVAANRELALNYCQLNIRIASMCTFVHVFEQYVLPPTLRVSVCVCLLGDL